MDKKTILKIADYLAGCLIELGVSVSEIILFGSRAQGNATGESDIDLAVVSGDFKGKGIFERSDMIGDATYKTIMKFIAPIDLVTISPDDLESETSIVAGYIKQGQVVYPAARRRVAKKKAG